MILQAGAGIIVNGLVPFSQMFQDAFGLEGVIAEDNAIAAAVQRCGWIIFPATRACRPVRPTRCRRSARQCVTGDGPFPDLGLVQALPPQHRGLLPVRGCLVLCDHPRPILRGKRAADRTRRRITGTLLHRPADTPRGPGFGL